MARNGPAPTPTEILAARGSWRAKTRPAEPRPASPLGEPPAWLELRACEVWTRIVEHLAAMGVGRAPDSAALARYCHATVRHQDAAAQLAAEGEVVIGSHGAKQNPIGVLVSTLTNELLRFEHEFGLTPAARASLHVENQPVLDGTAQKFGIVS